MLGPLATLASAAAGAFGGKKKGSGQPATQTQTSGYQALPAAGQANYNSFFQMMQQMANQMQNPAYRRQAVAPQSQFDSPELYALQQAMGNQGAIPTGMIEPLNQAQLAAYQQLANPNFSPEGLAPYMMPYQNIIDSSLRRINESADKYRSNAMGDFSRLNPNRHGGGFDSSQQRQLQEIENERQKMLFDAQAGIQNQMTQQALGLRNQALSGQLGAGNEVRGFNQSMLDAARGLTGMGQYAGLLGAMPNTGSSYQQGGTPYQPSLVSQLGAFGAAAMAPQYQPQGMIQQPSMMQNFMGSLFGGGR